MDWPRVGLVAWAISSSAKGKGVGVRKERKGGEKKKGRGRKEGGERKGRGRKEGGRAGEREKERRERIRKMDSQTKNCKKERQRESESDVRGGGDSGP